MGREEPLTAAVVSKRLKAISVPLGGPPPPDCAACLDSGSVRAQINGGVETVACPHCEAGALRHAHGQMPYATELEETTR